MEDRRTLIADAAIEVIARDGVRALTHRAVDAEAGLPTGSTSYYCRSRAMLLALTADRLVALLRGYVEVSGIEAARPANPEEFAELLGGMVAALLADYRPELTARTALIVELSGESDTSDLVAALLDPVDIAGAVESCGIRDVAAAAADILAVYEGVLWEHLVGRRVEDGSTDADAALLGAVIAAHGGHGRGLFGRRR